MKTALITPVFLGLFAFFLGTGKGPASAQESPVEASFSGPAEPPAAEETGGANRLTEDGPLPDPDPESITPPALRPEKNATPDSQQDQPGSPPEETGRSNDTELLPSAPPPQSLLNEGMIHIRDGLYEAGIVKLKQVLRDDPSIPEAWETLGWAYWLTGQRREAEEAWARLVSMEPNASTGYNLLAQAAARSGDFRRAQSGGPD